MFGKLNPAKVATGWLDGTEAGPDAFGTPKSSLESVPLNVQRNTVPEL